MLTDEDFRAIVSLATTTTPEGMMMVINTGGAQQYQALIHQLLQQEKGTLLQALLTALRRLKQTGDHEITTKDAALSRLITTLEQKNGEVATLRTELARNLDMHQKLLVELNQYRAVVAQQQQQQQLQQGFYLHSPQQQQQHQQQPMYLQQPQHVNYADLGKQVLINSYQMM